MSVQLLNSEYVKRVPARQLDAWVTEGKVKKQGDNYYVAGKNIEFFPQSCYVKEGDSAKLFKLNAKGTIVEKTTAPKGNGEVVGTPQKTYSVHISGIIERMGLTDPALQNEFKEFLQQQKGLTFDSEGNISFDNENKGVLNNALKAFAEQHKENFVTTNSKKYVEFTNESDAEVIEQLGQGDSPAIESDPVAGRKYAVKNEDALNQVLTTTVGETSYEKTDVRHAKVDASVTTATTTREGMVEVPDNLRTDKDARKALEAAARDSYAELVANADTEQRNAIDLYIAERKYGDQIEKKIAELSTYKTVMGGHKDERTADCDSAADIIQLYIDEYANAEDKDRLNGTVEDIQNSSSKEDQALILQALKDNKILGADNDVLFNKLPADLKHKGALICMAKECGYDAKTLARLIATYEVMNARSSEQVLEDDKYFIEQQAKDFVRNKQVEQDLPNMEISFSKKGIKALPGDGKVHTEIGKKGRELVKTCPEMLCDEITDPEKIAKFDENVDGCFKLNIKGKDRYFEFSPTKWKTFMGLCCDPSRVSDAEMSILFGGDENKKEVFLNDLNLTLQEGRDILDMSLPSPFGKTGTLKFSNIIGRDAANKLGEHKNAKLNGLRHMVESAGYSADGNSTYGKRLLHVLKNTGIAAATGFLTGGLGSLLAGPVAGMTDPQLISALVSLTGDVTLNGIATLKGPISITGDATLDYEDNVKTTDTTITNNNGETFIDSNTHNTRVTGKTTGQVTLTDDNAEITGNVELKDKVKLEGEVTLEAPGQKYSGNTFLKTAMNSSILAALGGVAKGLSSMGKVQERGRNTDDIFNLTRTVKNEEVEDSNLSLEIPQFVAVEIRKGTVEVGDDIPKLKVVKFRGPEAYSGLYQYEDGTPVDSNDFAKAYQAKIGGVMTDYNFFVYPELTLPNGKKIVPVDDYEAEYKKITQGISGGKRGVVINPQGKRTLQVEGTIK